jgi:hypothetical protein
MAMMSVGVQEVGVGVVSTRQDFCLHLRAAVRRGHAQVGGG